MSQNLEDLTQQQSEWTRFQFLRAAGIAGVGALLSSCASPGPVSVQNRSTTASPHIPEAGHTPNGLQIADPLDFSHLKDGRLDAWPWRYDLDPAVPGYTNEAAKYDDKHAWIHEGHLIISATRARGGYRSSRIDTQGNWKFKYGTITAEVMVPDVVGGWPALWFVPDQTMTKEILAAHNIPDKDPENDYEWGGEIDLSEFYLWQKPPRNQATVHTRTSMRAKNNDGRGIAHAETVLRNATSRYQKLQLHKAPGLIQMFVNGMIVLHVERKPGDTLSDWPFDDFEFIPVINLAMGEKGGQNFAGEMRDQFPPYGVDNRHVPAYFAIRSLHYQALKK